MTAAKLTTTAVAATRRRTATMPPVA